MKKGCCQIKSILSKVVYVCLHWECKNFFFSCAGLKSKAKQVFFTHSNKPCSEPDTVLVGDRRDYPIKPCTCCLSCTWRSAGPITDRDGCCQTESEKKLLFSSRRVSWKLCFVVSKSFQLCVSCVAPQRRKTSQRLYTQATKTVHHSNHTARMLGNFVKDVRNVNHLQSALPSHWSARPPPTELHWSLVPPAVSVGLLPFNCCAARHI